MLFKKLVFLSLFSVLPLAALQPNERASTDAAIFIEGAPLAESIPALKAVVTSVAGEGAWDLFAQGFEARGGINLLDLKQLEELGVDTKAQWGIVAYQEIQNAPKAYKPDFVGILPTVSKSKLFNFLKEKITQKSQNGEIANFQEIEPGKILFFGTEEDPGCLVNADDAVLISNNLDLAKQMRSRASSPVSKADYYKTMRNHLAAKNGGKQPIASFYLNPKMLVSTLDGQKELLAQLQRSLNGNSTEEPVIAEDSPLIKELSENLESAGGAFMLREDRVMANFSYKYKAGYLNDMSKVYPRMLQVKTQPLTSDTLSATPVHYTLFKFNIIAILDALRTASPLFNAKYQKAEQDFRNELHVELEKDILNSFRGNFNFQVLGIPSSKKLKDVLAWQLAGSFGIKSGSSAGWLKAIKSVEKKIKEKSRQQQVRFRYEKFEDGDLVTIQPVKNQPAGAQKNFPILILIRETEIVISTNKTIIQKSLKGAESTLSERLLRLPYDNAQAIFFIDLQQVVKALAKSKEASAIAAYEPMLKKLKNFSIISDIKKDFTSADFTLELNRR
ncbi:MAG: hypothetical protein LDLANPLL_01718 [Turneriella sp.]|nr:hypothetical protein [Turneriella sp.]